MRNTCAFYIIFSFLFFSNITEKIRSSQTKMISSSNLLVLHYSMENIILPSANIRNKISAGNVKRDLNETENLNGFDWSWLDECNNVNGK